MTLYVDSSAFVRRYVRHEPDHSWCVAQMNAHDDWITSRLTLVEAPRALQRIDPSKHGALIAEFDLDTFETGLIALDHGVISLARAIATETGVKTLDAIHIASAKQHPVGELTFLTFDQRQAHAAEQLGLRLARRTD